MLLNLANLVYADTVANEDQTGTEHCKFHPVGNNCLLLWISFSDELLELVAELGEVGVEVVHAGPVVRAVRPAGRL